MAEHKKLLLVCTPMRSGSGLMRDYLEGNRIPIREINMFAVQKPQALVQHLAKMKAPVVGVKLTPLHMMGHGCATPYEWLVTFLACAEKHKLKPAWVFLDRRNFVRQATSWVRAMKTAQPAIFKPSPAVPFDWDFDSQTILGWLYGLHRQRVWWQVVFGRMNLTPLRLFYEDFVADKQGTMAQVFSAVGIEQFTLDTRARVQQPIEEMEVIVQEFYDEVLSWGSKNWSH